MSVTDQEQLRDYLAKVASQALHTASSVLASPTPTCSEMEAAASLLEAASSAASTVFIQPIDPPDAV